MGAFLPTENGLLIIYQHITDPRLPWGWSHEEAVAPRSAAATEQHDWEGHCSEWTQTLARRRQD